MREARWSTVGKQRMNRLLAASRLVRSHASSVTRMFSYAPKLLSCRSSILIQRAGAADGIRSASTNAPVVRCSTSSQMDSIYRPSKLSSFTFHFSLRSPNTTLSLQRSLSTSLDAPYRPGFPTGTWCVAIEQHLSFDLSTRALVICCNVIQL